ALKYARYDGATLTTATIDSSGDAIAAYHSLAADAAGHVHVSYSTSHPPNFILKYAFFDGVSWSTATAFSGGAGVYNAIALDAASRPRIVYAGGYVEWNGSSWTNDSNVPGYQDFGLVLDGNGDPHISAFENAFGGLGWMHYLHRSGGAWQNTQVQPPTGGT